MKPVGKGSEYLYKISESICRNWVPSEEFAGWSYPSVKNPEVGNNVAIKKEYEQEYLEIQGAWLVQLSDFDTSKHMLKDGADYITTCCEFDLRNFPNTRPLINFDGKSFIPMIIKHTIITENEISWSDKPSEFEK